MKLKINAIAVVLILIIAALGINACKKEENPKPLPPLISQDSARALDRQALSDQVKHILGDSAKVIEPGRFQSDTTQPGVVAGVELSSPKVWGIKFTYFKSADKSLIKTYESPLLKGSFKGGIVRKIKLSGQNYEMIYYDSQDYFLGSGGGEVFSYIIDLNSSKVYSAHFFTVPKKPVSLYLSPNIDNGEIRDVFLKHFRRDYPDLKIVSKDYNLEDIF